MMTTTLQQINCLYYIYICLNNTSCYLAEYEFSPIRYSPPYLSYIYIAVYFFISLIMSHWQREFVHVLTSE